MLHLTVRPYHLRYHRPFATAHGSRTGTDAVFLQLVRNGVKGYGEAALPPYLQEGADRVRAVLEAVSPAGLDEVLAVPEALAWIDRATAGSKGARSALVMAYYDLTANEIGCSVESMVKVEAGPSARAMATLGMMPAEQVPEALRSLPKVGVLKVKVDAAQGEVLLKAAREHWSGAFFLDGNQGLGSVDQALRLLDMLEGREVLGFEQPFPVDRPELHRFLGERSGITVFADEAVQDAGDLDAVAGAYGGVNVKGLKCGGLDRALELARAARSRGLKVQLGCMSESSLGCAALLPLNALADLADLDGPWLIANDPFSGLEVRNGAYQATGDQGFGVQLARSLFDDPFGT